MLHNLRDRICSFSNLYGAYLDAAQDKRYRDEVLAFSERLEENLFDLQADLLNQTYTVGRYREFYVQFPKPRLVMALGFRDRIVQWAIYRQVNPYVDARYYEHSYGCRANKGTLAAAEKLLDWVQLVSRKPDAGDWTLIKGDISKYFYRVNHERAVGIYAEITDDPWFIWLISTIINNPDVPFGLPPGMRADDCPRERRLFDVGMPIGNLTSQATANIYLNKLDQFCKHVLKLHFYVRYMDDFCILVKGREEAKRIFQRIADFLERELELTISPKSQIVPATQPVEFVGYMVSPHGLRLRRKTTKHMKRVLRKTQEQFAAGEISLETASSRVNSYYGMTKHCNGHNMQRWIAENVVFQRREEPLVKLPDAQPPPSGRHFYSIIERDDGMIDVYLFPDGKVYDTDIGVKEYDLTARIVRGVEPVENIEQDIRARYYDWCASGEEIIL